MLALDGHTTVLCRVITDGATWDKGKLTLNISQKLTIYTIQLDEPLHLQMNMNNYIHHHYQQRCQSLINTVTIITIL